MEGELEPDMQGPVPVDMPVDTANTPDNVMVVEPAQDVMSVEPESVEMEPEASTDTPSPESDAVPPVSE
jgi:hypothetical protein